MRLQVHKPDEIGLLIRWEVRSGRSSCTVPQAVYAQNSFQVQKSQLMISNKSPINDFKQVDRFNLHNGGQSILVDVSLKIPTNLNINSIQKWPRRNIKNNLGGYIGTVTILGVIGHSLFILIRKFLILSFYLLISLLPFYSLLFSRILFQTLRCKISDRKQWF